MIELEKDAIKKLTPLANQAGLKKEDLSAIIAERARFYNQTMASLAVSAEKAAENMRAFIKAMNSMESPK